MGLVEGVVDASQHARLRGKLVYRRSEMAPTSGRLAVISVLKAIAGARYGFIL